MKLEIQIHEIKEETLLPFTILFSLYFYLIYFFPEFIVTPKKTEQIYAEYLKKPHAIQITQFELCNLITA